jgi:DNA-binding NarL/FixJ family response regulator
MSKIRVVLADDHYIVRNGIKALLEDNPSVEVIGEANNGIEAIQKVKELSPDVILMDITMPEMNGLQAAEIISKQYKNTRTLILSMHDNEDYVLRSLEVGAHGYLLKDSTREDIYKAVQMIHNGEKFYSSNVYNIIVNGYINKVKNKPSSGESVKSKLSRKEKEILKLIVEGKSSREIAELHDLSIRTVDNHRANMMKKLEVKNAAELVKLAIEEKLTD